MHEISQIPKGFRSTPVKVGLCGITKAMLAQDVLRQAGIDRYTDPANLVYLPSYYHYRMHSKYYYDYVNEVITTAWGSGGKEEVYEALDILKMEIVSGSLW